MCVLPKLYPFLHTINSSRHWSHGVRRVHTAVSVFPNNHTFHGCPILRLLAPCTPPPWVRAPQRHVAISTHNGESFANGHTTHPHKSRAGHANKETTQRPNGHHQTRRCSRREEGRKKRARKTKWPQLITFTCQPTDREAPRGAGPSARPAELCQ